MIARLATVRAIVADVYLPPTCPECCGDLTEIGAVTLSYLPDTTINATVGDRSCDIDPTEEPCTMHHEGVTTPYMYQCAACACILAGDTPQEIGRHPRVADRDLESAGLAICQALSELAGATALAVEALDEGSLIEPMREAEAACRAYLEAVEANYGPQEDDNG